MKRTDWELYAERLMRRVEADGQALHMSSIVEEGLAFASGRKSEITIKITAEDMRPVIKEMADRVIRDLTAPRSPERPHATGGIVSIAGRGGDREWFQRLYQCDPIHVERKGGPVAPGRPYVVGELGPKPVMLESDRGGRGGGKSAAFKAAGLEFGLDLASGPDRTSHGLRCNCGWWPENPDRPPPKACCDCGQPLVRSERP